MINPAPRRFAPTVAMRPTGPCAKTATVPPIGTCPYSAPMKPVDNISAQYTATSSGTLSGMRAMFPSASFTWKYSANTPSFVLENFHPHNGAPDCEECPSCEAESNQHGVIAPNRYHYPDLYSLT